MAEIPHDNISEALLRIPSGRFLLTAEFDGSRDGVAVYWVQPCAIKPAMVMVSVPKGNSVGPLIRDSRRFALCQLSASESHLLRRFEEHTDPEEDPFVGLDMVKSSDGSPILSRSVAYLACELARHVDIGSDHELYVGLIRDGGVLNPDDPEIILPPT